MWQLIGEHVQKTFLASASAKAYWLTYWLGPIMGNCLTQCIPVFEMLSNILSDPLLNRATNVFFKCSKENTNFEFKCWSWNVIENSIRPFSIGLRAFFQKVCQIFEKKFKRNFFVHRKSYLTRTASVRQSVHPSTSRPFVRQSVISSVRQS